MGTGTYLDASSNRKPSTARSLALNQDLGREVLVESHPVKKRVEFGNYVVVLVAVA